MHAEFIHQLKDTLNAALLTADAQELAPFPLWIGLSGGLDSVVLLRAVHALAPALARPVQLRAVHVNHQLSPNADTWTAFCEDLCAALQVPIKVARVQVVTNGAGLEDAARQARYEVFSECLQMPGLLALAHHGDDQIETLLLRLTRGTGLRGMAGMPAARRLANGRLIRPLLKVSRAQLESVAKAADWSHITDESNADESFDRNFMRHQILAPLQARFPQVTRTWGESMRAAGEAQTLMEDLARLDGVALDLEISSQDPSFSWQGLVALSESRQRNFLRLFIVEQAGVAFTRQQLADLVMQLQQAPATDALAVKAGAGQLRYFAGRVYWVRPQAALRLSLRAAEASGEWQYLRGAPEDYRVATRQGGERCRPAGRAHSQTVKKLLQERAVPPWRRENLPLVWCGDAIAAVGNYWICDGFVAENNSMAVKIVSLGD